MTSTAPRWQRSLWPRSRGWLSALLVLTACLALPVVAQDEEAEEQGPGPAVPWIQGPTKADLGKDLAQISLGEGYSFVGAKPTRELMQRMGNPPTDREVGLVTSQSEDSGWFLVFEYDDVGHVRDDDRDEIDADELLKSMREGTEAANEERQKMGFAPIHVTGWIEKPHYDEKTHNLVWALAAAEEGTNKRIANYNVRLLGREGYMSVTMATDADKLADELPEVRDVLAGFSYKQGQRYAEFVSGDKVAKYGLTALIAGGAGAAAIKLGLFAKLAKLLAKAWKLVAVGIVALGSAIKKLFTRRRTLPGLPDPPQFR